MNQNCDVLVIGGGPAGATAAALLAQRGHDVVVLEKDHHPRFHIGESLLPANLPLLDALGVHDAVRKIAMPKWGIEFVSPTHAQPMMIDFAEGWNKSLTHAYQVRRSDFDEILIRNAQQRGARVFEGCRAREIEFLPEHGGATVGSVDEHGNETRWQARFVVDASGRDTFLANRFKAKQKNERHQSSAIYAHFEGAERLPDRHEGNITIFWFDHGWFWFIPLTDGVTSVGAVCWNTYLKTRTKPMEQFFEDTIAMCPALAARLAGGRRVTPVEATGNYSYGADRTRGASYLLLGDAYAFIDPVFSSGVYLAMNSAFVGADAIEACLREPARSTRALARFDKVMRKGPRVFSWYIYRVTNPTMREMFMEPRNVLRVKEALLSMLAGDIFGRTPIWPSLWVFKAIYYLTSLANLKRTRMAAERRRINVAEQSPVG